MELAANNNLQEMNIQELSDTWNAGIHALAEAALDNLQGKESAVTPESCVAPVSTRDILYKILDHLITVNLPKRFSLEQRVAGMFIPPDSALM